ncbi:MAG: hypothetical protein R6V05_14040 [Candidatus Brocadiia bacterium]
MLKDCTASGRPRRLDITEPGFFKFIEQDLWRSSPCFQHAQPIHRICTLWRKMGVGTLYVEHLNAGEHVQQELDAVSRRIGKAVKPHLVRVSAFFGRVRRPVAQNRYLGYAAVLRLRLAPNTWRSYVIDAVVRAPSTMTEAELQPAYLMNNYLHSAREYAGQLADRQYTVLGTLFCQQNNLTSICAHAALRMAISNSCAPDASPLTTERINEILGVDHSDKPFGQAPGEPVHHGGLDEKAIWECAEQCGFAPKRWDFFANPNIEYHDVVYPMVESGCPTLLEFTTIPGQYSHVVPVLGHTLNTDAWAPQAEPAYSRYSPVFPPHISTSRWVDHFIISDDNFGPYLCLPVLSLRKRTIPRWDSQFRARKAIALFSQRVGYTSVSVERKAASVYWFVLKELSSGTATSRVKEQIFTPVWRAVDDPKYHRPSPVMRMVLSDRDAYLDHLRQTIYGREELPTDIAARLMDLEGRFWVCEVTLPDLYTGNKTKLGDILIGAGRPEAEQDDPPLLMARMRGLFLFPEAGNLLILFDPHVAVHTPLLRLASPVSPSIEW